MARKLVLIGAVSVGKGFTIKRLRAAFPQVPTIVLGEYLRDLRKKSLDFDTKYGPTMDAGNLLPDVVVIPHSGHLISGIQGEIAAMDGICRTANQIIALNGNGHIGDGDTFCILNASRSTCQNRHFHRTKAQIDGPRNDEAWFNERFELHRHHLSSIIRAASNVGVTIRHIDGDAPLDVIALEVATHMKNITGQKFDPGILASMA